MTCFSCSCVTEPRVEDNLVFRDTLNLFSWWLNLVLTVMFSDMYLLLSWWLNLVLKIISDMFSDMLLLMVTELSVDDNVQWHVSLILVVTEPSVEGHPVFSDLFLLFSRWLKLIIIINVFCNSLNLSYYTLDWRGVERYQRATVIFVGQMCVALTETVCASNVKKSRENVGKVWKEVSKHGA